MIDLDFLQRLIRSLDESSLDSIEIERGGTRIRLSKSAPMMVAPLAAAPQASPVSETPAPAEQRAGGAEDDDDPPASAPASHLVDVVSPMVGTFYRAPAPDAPSYVDVGDRISRGETLCIIEAMKLMNELEAEVSGTVVEVCVDNAEPVEYGQVLFRVDPS